VRALIFLIIYSVATLATARDFRIATYNASLNRDTEGQLITDLTTQDNTQAKRVAEIIQRLAPDILLINEFDYDAEGEAARLFQENYLSISQNGQNALVYPHRFLAESNTGLPTEFDFDFGFGEFPGQFGMVIYSKFPIKSEDIRTFQKFLWKDMPDNLLPASFYSAEEQSIFRLSSKSHWDLPIELAGQTLHVLASHPTPPVFDGPEDRNGRRNFDEIRLWADYLSGASYLYDDSGIKGGLAAGERFVIMGDQNADPRDGDSIRGAINQLLRHPFVTDTLPRSSRFGRDTAQFRERLRVDYVLPSTSGFIVRDSGVYWPTTQPESALLAASDHRPVWVDLTLIPFQSEAFSDLELNGQTLSWTAQEGVSYRLERSSNLTEESWESIDFLTFLIDGKSIITLPISGEPSFFRLNASFP